MFFTFLESMRVCLISKYINNSNYFDGTRNNRKDELKDFEKE